MKTTLIILFSLLLCVLPAQIATPTEQGLVTIGENATINEAIQILEVQSVKLQSKKIINFSSFGGAIGIPIHAVPWLKAMEMIALNNNLVLQEQLGFIAFANPELISPVQTEALDVIGANSKQVRINVIALVADRAYIKSLGIDWSTVFDGKVTVNAGVAGATQVPSDIFKLGAASNTTINGTKVEISTLLKAIESNQKGSVVAKPSLIVNSGRKGFIQVGQDISVKTVDEAGNTTDTFFATGVILNVLPSVVQIKDKEVVHLTLSIERSSATPGNVSTIINKSKSETELVLYDGEETVIGGLYDTDTITTRGGIPILKDLPWWVFGIRYLAGYNKFEIKERELVIFLKTDIVENALDRALKASMKTPTSILPSDVGDWSYPNAE
ncbi:MAG: type II and III secretion system protein [Candidatus Cloacimonetes bacterium]|jgi:type IV pilus assembly protein PilQ|nr:type II and III secretion system protein [Candidatus Cloacimonadota bacterium]MDD3563851.1 type II and III secretion system protein [Candidatus Cloacimonadota bacterium]MDD4277856.1 type II and III secretion system protein [Candidatus Cloacimonadota bacterium]MDY0326289.1 type II and III secretion system protein [Candidatus Cloacimonadaceae bacterium]